MDGNDDRIGSGERVDRYQTQRGAAVNQDIVVVILDGSQKRLEYLLAVGQIQHFNLGTHQIDVAGNDVQTVDVGGVDGVAHVGMVDDTFIERAVHILDVDTKTARSVGLRVSINNQYRLLQRGKRGCQVDGGGGLAYAAFLVG